MDISENHFQPKFIKITPAESCCVEKIMNEN